MSANIQDNNVTGETTVLIEVSVETASALASVLALVVDDTDNQGLESLFDALDVLGPVNTDVSRVNIEDNEHFDPEFDLDPYNIVVA